MKIIAHIFLLTIFIVVNVQPAYSKKGTDCYYYFFHPSPISKAKVQLMQGWDNHFKAVDKKTTFLSKGFISDASSKSYKNPKKAFLRSLILPGAGEYYVGKRTFAKTFLFTEITLWLSYFGFREYSQWVRDDALAFAATHSGAKIKGKPSQFYIDIGNYTDVYQYNDAKQRFFQFEKVYSDEDYFWCWDSDNNRRKFENMRIASDRALNRSVFVLGAIFANHIVSAVHAVWQTNRYNKKLEKMSDVGIDFHVGSDYTNGKIILTIQTKF
ncbi:MAG: hypothetical protein JSW07_15695 [bacterium]|nr:MAG: hypothetical protein JSW07_15695 [bacterium]